MTALLILMLKQNFLNIEIDIVARMKRSIIREIMSRIPFHSIQATLALSSDIVARMKRSIIREINSWIPFHSIQATLGAW